MRTQRKARPKIQFCLVFGREMLSVPVMRQVLGDTLRGIGVCEDSVADILLAATEACTNVILHAGQSAGAYTVTATVDGAACRIEVTDAGRGYRPPRGLPRLTGLPGLPSLPGLTGLTGLTGRRRLRLADPVGPASFDPAALAESGRGFAIMSACVDEVTLRSVPGYGTRVVLEKRISWAAPPPLAA